jgi:hypothetical protein
VLGLLVAMLVGDPRPFQLRVFEIQQECDLKSGNVQVSDHLGDVRVIEGRDDLGIHNHFAIYNQVGDELADKTASIGDGNSRCCSTV